MHTLEATIFLITLVIFSNIIGHYFILIPTALIEISVGLIMALIFNISIPLEADWFMLLFVAPLLFNDAKRFPKNELWELRAPIFANAILLVLLTTIIGGLGIYWLIPQLSLPLSMALAAVLSPTDPVAVHGIAERVHLPKKILTLISGESLINDASGLIAFKYALAAFLTGYFSLYKATLDFFYMSIVGGLIGYLFITLFHWLRIFLVQKGMRDVVLHTTIRILMPFIIFLVADEMLHASGVIAVVTAGIISIYQTPIFKAEFSEIRLITHKMWDVLIYILNGVVFVLLGLQLPKAMSETLTSRHISNWILIFYVFSIWLILIAIRTIWSYAYLWMAYLKDKTQQKPLINTALLTGLTGVRGAITMATIMSIPYTLSDGTFFVQRSLVIFLACGVVVMSLLVATITLPILTKQRERLILVGDDISPELEITDSYDDNDIDQISELEARQLMIHNAIEALKNSRTEENQIVVNDLIHEFENRRSFLYLEVDETVSNESYIKFEQKIKQLAIQGEIDAIQKIKISNDLDIPQRTYQQFLRVLHLKKRALGNNVKALLIRTLFLIQKQIHQFMILLHLTQKESQKELERSLHLIQLEKKATQGALHYLEQYKEDIKSDQENYEIKLHIANQLSSEYRNRIERIKHIQPTLLNSYQEQLYDLYLKALDTERKTVQLLLDEHKISFKTSQKLRQSINYSETSFLQR